jgi:hypothetical protein
MICQLLRHFLFQIPYTTTVRPDDPLDAKNRNTKNSSGFLSSHVVWATSTQSTGGRRPGEVSDKEPNCQKKTHLLMNKQKVESAPPISKTLLYFHFHYLTSTIFHTFCGKMVYDGV